MTPNDFHRESLLPAPLPHSEEATDMVLQLSLGPDSTGYIYIGLKVTGWLGSYT